MGNHHAKSPIQEALANPDNIKAVEKAFLALDANGNKVLDRKEFQQFLEIGFQQDLAGLTGENLDEFVDAMFEAADYDQDGYVSFDEFKTFLCEYCEDS